MKQKTSTKLSQYPDILSAAQMREILGTSRRETYQLISSGQVGSFMIGRVHKIPKSALLSYIQGKEAQLL